MLEPLTTSMNWQEVDSSILNAINYDAKDKLLMVKMAKSGNRRIYYEVPEHVYRALLNADSQGKYFLKNIRGKYRKKEMKKYNLFNILSNWFKK